MLCWRCDSWGSPGKKRYRRGAASSRPVCGKEGVVKIEEGQAARRRAKARGEMGWPRFLSLKYECVDQPALPAGLWKSERIVREAMHEPYEPSIGHLGGRQSYHSYSDRFVMQEAYSGNSDCVSFAGSRWDARRRCPPPTGGSQAGLLAAHCARRCTAQMKTDTPWECPSLPSTGQARSRPRILRRRSCS